MKKQLDNITVDKLFWEKSNKAICLVILLGYHWNKTKRVWENNNINQYKKVG